MKVGRISGGYLSLLVVAAIFCIAFFIRAYFPADRILGSEWVKFSGTDAYYHMRLVDNIVANFPRLTAFDPYHIFPGGVVTQGSYFLDWFLAAIIWLIGFGSPSPGTVDFIGVYFPAVLGALTVIPVYFLGRELFNRWAGFIAAVLVALLPGEFLSRSILGFTENHVAEVLFSTTAVLFFVRALKSARRANLTFGNLGGWRNISRPLVFALLGGLFIGLYFITWIGAELFVFIIFLFLVVQMVIDHLQRKTTDYLGIVSAVFFFTLIAVYLGLSRTDLTFHYLPLIIALLVPPVLVVVSRLMVKLKMRPVYFPLAILGLGAAIIAVQYALSPGMLGGMVQKFSIFFPTTGTNLTTLEMRPFFAPLGGGNFFWTPAWLNLYTALPLSIFAFFILTGIMWAKRQFAPERVFFLLWSLVIFIITAAQRRFDYYYTINAALLTGYIAGMLYLFILLVIGYLKSQNTAYLRRQIHDASGLEVVPAIGQPPALPEGKGKTKKDAPQGRSYFSHILAGLLIFFLVVFPGLGTSLGIAKAATFVPSDGWCAALTWLKENSPEPLGDPGAYYRMYPPGFDYPDTAYGVMSWWDYGYWITRIAHRIPVTNPSQDSSPIIRTAGVLLSQDEASAGKVMEESKTRYVIADNAMATAKFWAIAQWNGQDQSDYYGTYFVRQGNQLFPRTFYYPEYYRSLLVRLYNFDGKAVTPGEIKVISYQDKVTTDGFTFRMVTDNQTFPDYRQAVDFMSRQEGNYRIVSDNPFASSVPLEALGDYRLVFSSKPTVSSVPEVKIYEFKPD